MTTGRFYIDGKDAYAAYGVFVANNGYTGLISFPPYKELDKNDFEEENGIDVDLTSPAFSVRVCCSRPAASIRESGSTW